MTMKLGVQEEPAIYKVLLGLPTAAPLARVAEFNPRRHSVPPADADLVSFVPMRAVAEESGHIDADAVRPWSEVKKGYTAFQNGDVIFAKITPCMENGKFALASGLHNGRAAGSTEFHVFRPKPGLLPKYLFHFLFTPQVRRGAKMNMKGAAGQLRVPIQFFEGLRIPLPAPEEQQRVIDYLDEQLTRLDASVSTLHRVRANLKRYRASVLKSACEGRLVPTEAELARQEGRTFETGAQLLQRVLAERRRTQMEKSKFGEPEAPTTPNLPELPEGWGWASAAQACDPVVDCHNKTAPYTHTGIPLVRTTNIRDGQLLLDGVRFVDQPTYTFWSRRCPPEPGDVLFTREAPMGEAAIIPPGLKLCLGQRTMLMRPSPAISSAYLLSALTSMVVQRLIQTSAVGSGVKHLRVGDVERLPIPLPPLAEQHRIVAEADRRLSLIRVAEAQVAANLARAQRLRQSILQAAFSGPGATAAKT